MKNIVIVGAGVSGLTLAINVKTEDNEVILLEKNNESGKKILITGNGRCNFLNDNFDYTYYHSIEDYDLSSVINKDDKDKVLDFITSLGIEYKIKNGYYYPFTNKASTIRNTLVNEALKRNVRIIHNYKVNSVKKEDNYFIVNNDIKCDYLIFSSGSKSYEITGSTGDGYKLLSSFNHSVTNLYPSLVQITAQGKFLKKLHGVRTDALVSIWNGNQKIKEEYGELQLTDYGVSGICIFNLSRYVNLFDETLIKINFIPYVKENVYDYLEEKNKLDLKVCDLLYRMLNEKIVNVILELLGIDLNIKYSEVSKELKNKLVNYLINFTLVVTGTKSFDNSQVTAGGIRLDEINVNTYESKLVKNLFIVGELLDIDGDCGGYNIAFAMLSALKASEYIRGKND